MKPEEEMLTKRLLLSLTMAVLLSLVTFLLAAKSTDSTPTAEVTIKVAQVAAGLRVTWGNGILNFMGKEYEFKVSGLNLIGLGVTSIKAKGDIYNFTT